jgi:NADP-dependent 3-hydroxy acid dehydrogenase YdfG
MELTAGKTAVVTGAASGIGLALTNAFAARGLNVVLADVNEDALAAAGDVVRSKGGRAVECRCDVAVADEVERMRARALRNFGRVDIICNNAGVMLPFEPTWQHSLAEWKWLLGINLMGVVHGIQTFLPLLVEQRSGHLLNTASMAGVATIPFNGPYNASKHAVVALTETIAAEMVQLRLPIGATVLCCGLVATGIRSSVQKRPGAAAYNGEAAGSATTPTEAGGNHLSADEVAALVMKAIEINQLHVFTNPGSAERIQARIDRLVADL